MSLPEVLRLTYNRRGGRTACVVDENIDRTHSLLNGREPLVNCVKITQVPTHSRCIATDVADCCNSHFGRYRVYVCNSYCHAFRRQSSGYCATKTASGAEY
jgi:hypothetical protein